MNVSRRRLIGAAVATCAGLAATRNHAAVAVLGGVSPPMLTRAMAALERHASSIPHRDIVAFADFSAPSRLPRLQIVDVGSGLILSAHLVAHGRGSDPENSGWLELFSNRPGSNASCQGAFVTEDIYYGKHGRSRRLLGLDRENSNAAGRSIVIHAADYVDPGRAVSEGRIGRSQGCFAVSPEDIGDVLARLGPGRLLFAGK